MPQKIKPTLTKKLKNIAINATEWISEATDKLCTKLKLQKESPKLNQAKEDFEIT